MAILVVGTSGIVAQVLFLREFLISFYGNELTLGLILANWVISEAIGVFIIGKLIDRIKNKIDFFILLQLLFCLILPIFIYISRILKNILEISPGEIVGIFPIFLSSFFIIFPISFCHGGLFSSGAKVYSQYFKESSSSIGKIYTWETAGTIIGGIILTYFFIPLLNSFQIVFIISIFNLIVCFLLFKYIQNKILKYVSTLFFILVLFFGKNLNYINALSIKAQWKSGKVLDYRNSIYGNITIIKKERQYTFFYNGIPIITMPYPDIMFVEEFANLPLLFHNAPKDILIISAGAGGLINEILKHPIKKIDYAELDPLIIEMLKKYPSYLTQKELYDKRVKILNLDGRFFVRTTLNKYDIILIGLSRPADLSTNRLFTQEFFSLIKKRLNQNGILTFWLPASLTYLSQELKDLNACILNGLKDTYRYVRIIPGDYNIFLASESIDMLKVSPMLITQRINQRNLKTNILTLGYLDYRLHKRWTEWFDKSLKSATKKINQDFMPIAVFQMNILWNKQFFSRITHILVAFENLDLRILLIVILFITFILLYLFYCKRNWSKLSIAYSIATTGFFGMLINLILIFSFQVSYGYLYHSIGMLISIFMAGIATGSIFMTAIMKRIKNSLSSFIRLEILIIIFSYTVAMTITRFNNYIYLYLIFITLFFVSGLLMGLEFPLASKMYLKKGQEVGFTAGLLYFSDLIGGWVAGILGGVVFLPILGLFNTCMIIILCKLSSLLLLVIFSKRLTPPFIQS